MYSNLIFLFEKLPLLMSTLVFIIVAFHNWRFSILAESESELLSRALIVVA